MSSTNTTTTATKKFTVSLTKSELDSIQRQFLEELQVMLDIVRTRRGEEGGFKL
jgi:hypothetical protein